MLHSPGCIYSYIWVTFPGGGSYHTKMDGLPKGDPAVNAPRRPLANVPRHRPRISGTPKSLITTANRQPEINTLTDEAAQSPYTAADGYNKGINEVVAMEDSRTDDIFTALMSHPELIESSSRLFRIPVFLSMPNSDNLNSHQLEFVIRLIREIRRELFFPRTLPRTESYPEPILTNVRRMILSSYGLVAANLALEQVKVINTNGVFKPSNDEFWLGTAFSQIEPTMAYQYGLPLLLIIQSGVQKEGIYSFGVAPFTILTWNSDPLKPTPDDIEVFFNGVQWKEILKNWAAEVRNGYYIQTSPEFAYACEGKSL